MGNQCVRMWERKHTREGCCDVESHLRFMVKMSREARGHSCGFISSPAQAWIGKIVSGQEAVEQKQWRGRGK